MNFQTTRTSVCWKIMKDLGTPRGYPYRNFGYKNFEMSTSFIFLKKLMCFDPILRAESIFEGFSSFGDVLGELWKKQCFFYYTYYASRKIEILMFFWKTMMEILMSRTLFKISMKNILFFRRSICFLCFCTRLAEFSPKTHVSAPSCFLKMIFLEHKFQKSQYGSRLFLFFWGVSTRPVRVLKSRTRIGRYRTQTRTGGSQYVGAGGKFPPPARTYY